MNITLVFAESINHVIGLNDSIPWYYSEDLKHFKEVTNNHAIIMGYGTWESLPHKPLPDRLNIVVSKNHHNDVKDDSVWCKTIKEAVEVAKTYAMKNNQDEIFIIGGENIFAQTLDIATKAKISRINLEIEGDKFAPDLEAKGWHILHEEKCPEVPDLRFIEFAK